MDPATKPMLDAMLGADGKPRVCERVWISSIGCGGDDTKEQTGKLTAGFGATVEKIGPVPELTKLADYFANDEKNFPDARKDMPSDDSA